MGQKLNRITEWKISIITQKVANPSKFTLLVKIATLILMLINFDQRRSELIGIDQHWEEFQINAMLLIGIDPGSLEYIQFTVYLLRLRLITSLFLMAGLVGFRLIFKNKKKHFFWHIYCKPRNFGMHDSFSNFANIAKFGIFFSTQIFTMLNIIEPCFTIFIWGPR